MKKVALIIAGGSGQRMGYEIPKQFIEVNNKPIIIYTLEAFQNHPSIDSIIVVCIKGWIDILESYAKKYNITKLKSIVLGGATGQNSIKCGLDATKKLYKEKCIVLIHDAIRPMVTNEIISDNIAKCELYGNATTVVPCTTVALEKTCEEYSLKEVNRDNILLTQTPQAFILDDILAAHKEAKEKGINAFASCALYVKLGRKVYYSVGDEINIKLTRPSDIEIFKALLNLKEKEKDKR